MYVSVIIPTCNRPASLARAVASIQKQTRPADELIIAHDDAGRRGAAATRNRGAAKAHGELFIFMDDDCVAAPDCIEKLIAAFKEPRIVAVAGAIIYVSEQHVAAAEERVVQNRHARWFMGALCATRRETFQKVGGFPQDFFAYEDKAFALACAPHGIVARVPHARVYHEKNFWTPELRARHTKNLTHWHQLAARYDLYADPEDPPPLFARHILLPKDFGAIIKNFFHTRTRAHAQLLARQRVELWKSAWHNKIFMV